MSSSCTRRLATTAAVLLFVASGARLGAQSEPATIPAGLATALIAGGSTAPATPTTHYMVGVLPPGWPPDLVIPSPALVVGGMMSGSTLVAVFGDSARRLLREYVGWLNRAGYQRPAPPSIPGFQPSLESPLHYCRGLAMVRPTSVPGPLRSTMHVVYQPESPSLCAIHPQPESSAPEVLALPRLAPPPYLRGVRSGSNSNSDEVYASTRLIGTTSAPAAVAEHYAAQLIAVGWTASPPVADERVAVQAFRARDESGKAWSGTLAVAKVGTNIHVSLTMQREEDR
jgi:hypothetical protein